MKPSYLATALAFCHNSTVGALWRGLRTSSMSLTEAISQSTVETNNQGNSKSNKSESQDSKKKPESDSKTSKKKSESDSKSSKKKSSDSKTSKQEKTCNCDPVSEVCSNIYGSFVCVCAEGYQDNGGKCEVVTQDCSPSCNSVTEVCLYSEGSYKCACAEGYINVKGICTSTLNENCTTHGPVAQDDFYESNRSYFSIIHNVLNNDAGDQLVLESINEDASFGNCFMDGQEIRYTRGYDDGYFLGEDKCVYKCCDSSGCCDTASFRITINCPEGYGIVNGVCTDIDECSANLHDCVQGEVCVNEDGSYLCLSLIAQDIISAGVPEDTISLFHPEIFKVMATDSPTGFISGETSFDQAPLELESSLNFEATNSMFHLDGTFIPSDGGTVPEGTLARVYSPVGLHATTGVDSTGQYSLTLTDIAPGRTPFILTFSSPSFDGTSSRRRLTGGATQCPKSFWIFGSLSCSSSLTFQLQWDQPTSDVDLHVSEPNGTHVYFNNMVGDYGELDVDDRTGFGPEHYTAPEVSVGEIYTAYVHLYDINEDSLPLNYSLRTFFGSTPHWTRDGMLFYDNATSEDFAVTIPESINTCQTCSSNSDSGIISERHLLDVPPCCPPDKWGYFCSDYQWACDDDDARWSWKVYNDIVSMNPTKQNIMLYINLILVPHLSSANSKEKYKMVADAINNGDGDIECLRYQLLAAYCKIFFGKDMEFYLKKVHLITHSKEEVLTEISKTSKVDEVLELIGRVVDDTTGLFHTLRRHSKFDDSIIPWAEHITARIGCGFMLSKYRLMTYLHGPSCPEGFHIAETECLDAGLEVGAHFHPQSWLNAGDWDYTPCGCFLWKTSDGTVYVDYDRGLVGQCKSSSSTIGMICKENTKPYQLLVALQGPRCPRGLEVSQPECLAAGLEVGAQFRPQSWLNAGDWDYTPCGCFLWRTSDGTVYVDYDRGLTGQCKSSSSTVGMVCRTQHATNLVDFLYTFGAPSVAVDPPNSNPGNKCIPGIRTYTEDMDEDGEITNTDFAAQINLDEGYPHPKMSTLVLRLHNGVYEHDFYECQDADNEHIYNFQWFPDVDQDDDLSGHIHSIEPSYEPRLKKVDLAIRGPLLEYGSAAVCVYSETEDEENDSISRNNAVLCLANYKTRQSNNNLPGVWPTWKIIAWMNRHDILDDDIVYVLGNDEDPNFRRCILSFSGTNGKKVKDGARFVWPNNDRSTFCGRGGIHAGVRNELRDIIKDDAFANVIKPALETCHEVTCVGHSLGGALCSLLTMCVNQGLEYLDVTDDKTMWDDYKSLAWSKPQRQIISV